MIKHEVSAVILAAGKGVRMLSSFPKVLHPLAGKAMVQHVIDTLNKLNVNQIYLVYGYGGDFMKKALFNNNKINWILQSEQLGTGHAMQQVVPYLNNKEDILILYGDVPLVSIEDLVRLIKVKPYGGIGLITTKVKNPIGYGRIIRKKGKIIDIIEHKDINNSQSYIHEVNTGILAVSSIDIKRWLTKINNNNAQGEYYVTDIVKLAHREGREIIAISPRKANEVRGVNNFLQLSLLERSYQNEQAKRLLLQGVMLCDPTRFDLRGTLKYGRDVEIDINVILEGEVQLGSRVKIGAGCIIKDSIIDDDCKINPYSIVECAHLKTSCVVGPFVHLRPGVELLEGAYVGNFVEMKKSRLGKDSKVGHLTYLGDADIGNNVNIGAGTITCNFDGVNKFKTIIEDDVFVGSDTQLIAPVTIRKGATIAAGTTITRNVMSNELALSRIPQINKQDWQRPVKKK